MVRPLPTSLQIKTSRALWVTLTPLNFSIRWGDLIGAACGCLRAMRAEASARVSVHAQAA